jgi:hypothetical protein
VRTKRRVMKTHKIVKVEWEDSASYSGWTKREKTEEFDPYACISCGILVRTNKGSIGVTHSISKQDVDNVMVIPKKAVKKVEVIGKIKI